MRKSSPMQMIAMLVLILMNGLGNVQAQNAENIALEHIQNVKSTYQLTAEDVADIEISSQHTSKKSQITHIYLQQKHNDIPLQHANMNIHIDKTGKVFKMNSSFVPDAANKVKGQASLSAEQALTQTMEYLDLPMSKLPKVEKRATDQTQKTVFDKTGLSLEALTAQLLYVQQGKKGIHLVWEVAVYQLDGQHWWHVKLDANTGKVINKEDRVLHCSFGSPDCPEEHIFHRHEEVETASPAYLGNAAPDSYRVYPLGVESPNHGVRTLVVNPADANASPFGWHDNNGNTGAEFTITRGNNVHAQEDQDGNNGTGYSPNAGASLDFDYPINLANNAATYEDAAITNLFYWNNIMHDLWYQYGFDEAAGNFQDNNYGNGGSGGDYVLADAQDGSGTNNANFSSPADGGNGRMQMFLWSGASSSTFNVNSTGGIAGGYASAGGSFGPSAFNVTGNLVVANDGSAAPTEACNALNNAAAMNGNIAVIDRGSCNFTVKALNAQNAGAIAAIICNNVADPIFIMGGTDNNVTIPSVMISQSDCAMIRAQIPTVNVTLSAVASPETDGDLDNGIIAHEYGHGISIRLTGGGGNSGCLSNDEQQGEGWSDWLALVLTVKPTDTRTTSRGIGTFAIGQPISGGGIRTYPYTTNMGINQHTYDDIMQEALPHGVGSVWCAMIWDLYWDLVDTYGYDADLYNGTGGNNVAMNLVIEGMKLQPCSPGFADSRDAIIAADQALYNGANYCIIWQAFARRGLGFSANQGSSGSRSDGAESFDLPPDVGGVNIVKTANKTEAAMNEVVTFNLEISNLCVDATNVTIEDDLPVGLTYINGSATSGGTHNNGIISWPALPAFAVGGNLTYTYQARVANGTYVPPSTIFNDNMESGAGNFSISSALNNSNWTLTNNPECGSTAFFAEELDGVFENQYLTIGPLAIGRGSELSFDHYFDTEDNWDGGQVDISMNGGLSWTDLGAYMTQNGYNDFIQNNSGNPAFAGTSGGCITTTVDLDDFCSPEALIRFDFYYDTGVTGNGWYVDNVQVTTEATVINTAAVTTSGITVSDFACVRVLNDFLPVELMTFTASAQERDILLEWATATELNSEGFQVARRAEGELEFTQIGWVQGQGNSTTVNTYNFTDTDVLPNVTYYYQLVQTDTDGRESFSDIVSAEIIDLDAVYIDVFPNPTKQKRFNISISGSLTGTLNLDILNTQGQLLRGRLIDASTLSGGLIEMDVQELPAGIYFIKIETGQRAYVKKIVVK